MTTIPHRVKSRIYKTNLVDRYAAICQARPEMKAAHAHTSEPLHRQVSRQIADQIASGALVPGQRLPPERTLAEQLAVSRVTVRRALKELGETGLVESFVGRGTFVTARCLDEPPNALMGFTELNASRGLVPSARILMQVVRSATYDESERLRHRPRRGSLRARAPSPRLLDGVPTTVDHNVVPLALAPALPAADFTRESLFEILDESGSAPFRADYSVEADAVGAASRTCSGSSPAVRCS